jgi:hypothetical protein
MELQPVPAGCQLWAEEKGLVMAESRLLQQIALKEADKGKIAGKVIKKPGLLPELLRGLKSDRPAIKYGCAKVLRVVSDRQPGLLYPWFDFFVTLLDSDNKIMQWEGIHVIANLAAVDAEGKFEKVFDKYFAPILGPAMITAANVVGGAAKIAEAKPDLTEKITKELLKVDEATYKTTECRNVALGHVIKSFDKFFDQIKDKASVIKLIKKQLSNTRNATRKAAAAFLKKRQDEFPASV